MIVSLMKYTDKKAQALAQAWALSKTTVRVWKSRGHIPDEYARPPIPIKTAIKILNEEWWNEFKESISDKAELERYMEKLVPKSITAKELMQRLRDFRRWLRKK